MGLLVSIILEHGSEMDIQAMLMYMALMFTGPGNQKPLEEFNKAIKEYVYKIAASKFHHPLELWALPRTRGLPGKFGRADVKITAAVPVSAPKPPEEMFEVTEASVASEGGDTLLDLKSITGDPPDWNNSPSVDVLEGIVEEQLLRAWAKTEANLMKTPCQSHPSPTTALHRRGSWRRSALHCCWSTNA